MTTETSFKLMCTTHQAMTETGVSMKTMFSHTEPPTEKVMDLVINWMEAVDHFFQEQRPEKCTTLKQRITELNLFMPSGCHHDESEVFSISSLGKAFKATYLPKRVLLDYSGPLRQTYILAAKKTALTINRLEQALKINPEQEKILKFLDTWSDRCLQFIDQIRLVELDSKAVPHRRASEKANEITRRLFEQVVIFSKMLEARNRMITQKLGPTATPTMQKEQYTKGDFEQHAETMKEGAVASTSDYLSPQQGLSYSQQQDVFAIVQHMGVSIPVFEGIDYTADIERLSKTLQGLKDEYPALWNRLENNTSQPFYSLIQIDLLCYMCELPKKIEEVESLTKLYRGLYVDLLQLRPKFVQIEGYYGVLGRILAEEELSEEDQEISEKLHMKSLAEEFYRISGNLLSSYPHLISQIIRQALG